MSAAIDTFTGQPDRAQRADAALEAEIDAAWAQMRRAPTEASPQAWFTIAQGLMRHRSQTQLVKLEFERRALMAEKA